MTHYWMIITAGKVVTQNCKVYKLKVPSTEKGSEDIEYIRAWCRQQGFYCGLWDNKSVTLLQRITESINRSIISMQVLHFDASYIKRIIKNENGLPQTQILTPEGVKILQLFNPELSLIRKINVLREAEAERRSKPKAISCRKRGFNSINRDTKHADGMQE